ncbi:hypothetical protein [Embleya hyalina]|uniref:Uncharacterized protein n=1 Tax=Embleya hyalina TaxID=516124 RepID=A0A401YLY2_9ACTN|nr:hypothetical protein [Embleya hyalina]GCD95611.1 hypothetical protein EHYA_03286 [Embleya hyalina]
MNRSTRTPKPGPRWRRLAVCAASAAVLAPVLVLAGQTSASAFPAAPDQGASCGAAYQINLRVGGYQFARTQYLACVGEI